MDIVLVSATPFEIAPVTGFLNRHFESREHHVFIKDALTVRLLITGVGIAATSWSLGQFLARHKPALAIQAGIAGAFDPGLELGTVIHVIAERFGDLGVEEADGNFTDLFELGFTDPESGLYRDGKLINPDAGQTGFLPSVQGLTVNKVHGTANSIALIRQKYPDAQVESMEGAAFFQACLLAQIPFLEIRSISNAVEPRNREAWNLPLAIDNLNTVLIELLGTFIPPVR